MARSMWSGSISFGLVNIPVKLFSAVHHQEVRFHMVHDKDGGRIRQKRVCEVDGQEVPYQHISKGYELSPGSEVVLEPEELEKLDPKATRTIDIEDFVELSEVDPIFYDGNYYLVPDRGAQRPYGLLLEAMRRSNKVGIARMVMRTKQYLCALRPKEDALMLHTLLYNDEIVSEEDLEDLGKHHAPAARELQMAEQLVNSLSGKWKPEKYKDEYRDRVKELIKMKAEGQEIVTPVVEEAPKVVNLMDALRQSLERADKPKPKPKPKAEAGELRHRPHAARTARSKAPAKKKAAPKAKSARKARA